ncbi:MAG: HEAT repeat domain-containing protein [Planctomycetota bacterium]|jgi:HEAT repeat protein|nr:HEAT repeat domain-containing protein [Planctomycetota bacterium]
MSADMKHKSLQGRIRLALGLGAVTVAAMLFLTLSKGTTSNDVPEPSDRSVNEPPEIHQPAPTSPEPDSRARPSKTTLAKKDPDRPPRYRLKPGDILKYRVHTSQAILFRSQATPSPTTQSVRIELTGFLQLTTYRSEWLPGPKSYLLGLRYSDIHIEQATGEEAREGIEQLESELENNEIMFQMTPRGQILQIYFPPPLSPVGRNTALPPLLDLQIILPPSSDRTWQFPECDLMGHYRAHYRLESESWNFTNSSFAILKSAEDYDSVDNLAPPAAGEMPVFEQKHVRFSAQARAQFDPTQGVIEQVEGRQTMTVLEGTEAPFSMSGKHSFTIKLEGNWNNANIAAQEPFTIRAKLENRILHPLGARPLASRVDQKIDDRDGHEEISLEEIVKILDAMERFQKDGSGATAAAVKLFYRLMEALEQEENLSWFTKTVLEGQYASLFGQFLGILEGLGTPQAQDTLRQIAKNPRFSISDRAQAVSALAMVESPSDTTIEALVDFMDQPNEEINSAALLGLGTASNRLQSVDPSLFREVLHILHQRLESPLARAQNKELILTSIGNAGSTDSLPYLRLYAQNEDPLLRSAALSALGFLREGTEPVTLLQRALEHDTDPLVLERAARALSRHGSSEALSIFRTQAVKSSSVEVRMEALNYLYHHNTTERTSKKFFEDIARSDPSDAVRRFASDLSSSLDK